MKLIIENFCFEAIIGILKEERLAPQNVSVDASISYDYKMGFLDYMKICKEIKREFNTRRFRLLEEAAIAVCEALKSKNPSIRAISIKIIKPDIRSDAKVGVRFEREF